MGRGVLTGLLIGALVSAGVLAAVSLSAPVPQGGGADPEGVGEVEVLTAEEGEEEADEAEIPRLVTIETAPAAEEPEAAEALVPQEAEEAEEAAAPGELEVIVVPVEAPEAEETETEAPEAEAAPEEEAAAEAPQDASEMAGAMAAPDEVAGEAGDAGAEAETVLVPLEPVEVLTEAPEAAPAPTPDEGAVAGGAIDPGPVAAPVEPAETSAEQEEAPQIAQIAPPLDAQTEEPEQPVSPEIEIADLGSVRQTTQVEVEIPREPGARPAAPQAEAALAAQEAPAAPPEEEPEAGGDTIVIAAIPEDGAGEGGGADAEDASPPEGPALEAAAIPFEPTARPALGIVLHDEGPLPDPSLVAGLPFPLSVVVDPEAPDAAERMAFWRGVGAEIALSAGLPEGAAPQDAATAVEAWRRAVPWAVAAVEERPGSLQGDREILGQLLSGLSESGHGVLFHSRGLNSARAEAEREGVPAGLIFRDIDGAGETPPIIRRFLDQAAFRASRNDGVILMGRATPETIETIRDWSLQGRGQTVAIAPLSAMLPAAE